jgi:nicotinamide mononucleotide adenylyltransferase
MNYRSNGKLFLLDMLELFLQGYTEEEAVEVLFERMQQGDYSHKHYVSNSYYYTTSKRKSTNWR